MRIHPAWTVVALLAMYQICAAEEAKQNSYHDKDHRKHNPQNHHEYHDEADPSSPGGYEHYDHPHDYQPPHEYHKQHGPERSDPLPNELGPNGEWPDHLRLRLVGVPVGHTMNMSAPINMEAKDIDERHAPVMKMYDAYCDVPRDPPYGEAVPVGHVGHFHVTYKPAHHQKPWRLWGQTVLRIGKISAFELAHLDDDNDESLCATFFNQDTVITPVNDPTIYNLLIKPKYPVNMQYVLDGMRAMPIPAKAAAYSKPSGDYGETSYSTTGGKADKIDQTPRVILENAEECRVAQAIWGRLSITTKVNGQNLKYEGTLYAVPDLDTAGTMVMPRSGSESGKIIEAMCKDDVVKQVVPWSWEFDLRRVAASQREAPAAELGLPSEGPVV